MASRRMIDPAFWRSESMVQLTKEQRLLFLGLISNADDQGRLRAHPALIRSDIFPFEDEPLDKIATDLDAIAQVGSIMMYEADGSRYIQIVNWWTYQKPKWAWPSKMPAPPDWMDRERYRVGNRTVKSNWDDWDYDDYGSDGDDSPDDDPLNDSETTVESERDGNENLVNSAPRTSGSDSGRTSDSGSVLAGADAPDPRALTLNEIRRLELPDEQWRALLDLEKQGKNRKGVAKFVKARLDRPPPAVLVYQRAMKRFPPRGDGDKLWKLLDEAIGRKPEDLEFWSEVVHGYEFCGWNPCNIANMLNFYYRREIPPGDGRRDNGARGSSGGAGAGPPPAISGEKAEKFRQLQAERKRQKRGEDVGD